MTSSASNHTNFYYADVFVTTVCIGSKIRIMQNMFKAISSSNGS